MNFILGILKLSFDMLMFLALKRCKGCVKVFGMKKHGHISF